VHDPKCRYPGNHQILLLLELQRYNAASTCMRRNIKAGGGDQDIYSIILHNCIVLYISHFRTFKVLSSTIWLLEQRKFKR
jgi:hypothetical protein